MDSTDDTLLLRIPSEAFNWRHPSFSNRYTSQTREIPDQSAKNFHLLQGSLQPSIRCIYRRTHKNLQHLVDNMYKQFQETVPLEENYSPPKEVPSKATHCRQRVRPSTAVRDKHVRAAVKRNIQINYTFQTDNQPQRINSEGKQDNKQIATDAQSPKNRDKMLQALLSKLESKEQILTRVTTQFRKVRPISSHLMNKRAQAKLTPNRRLDPQSQKQLISKSLDQAISSERYQMQEVLGAGAYATVKKAKDTLTDRHVAIKSYERSKLFSFERRSLSLHEIKILEMLDHPCIIKLINVLQTKQSINLVLEYCGKQSLYMVLKEKSNHRFPEQDFKPIYQHIVSAVEHCHNRGISHRDIKIENILVNNGQVKIIDFGLAAIGPPFLLTSHCGTPSYMPPEVCQRRSYKGSHADVWALGIVLYVSLVGKFPFQGKTDEELFKNITCSKLKLPGHLSSEAKSLLSIILEKDCQRRPTVTSILKNQWFMTN